MTKISVDKLPSPRTYVETRRQNETLQQALRWAEDRIRKLEGELIAATNKATHPPGWRAGEGIWHYCADGHNAVCGGTACIECLIMAGHQKIALGG